MQWSCRKRYVHGNEKLSGCFCSGQFPLLAARLFDVP